jgi:lysophospholipase L1-like esterase
MKYIYSSLKVLWLTSFFTLFAHYLFAQSASLVEAKELRIRDGLPHILNKLKSGKPVTIAYFGGSITEAGNGWREQSTAWLQAQYPKAKINSVNAAIGGTGSDLGVFRLRQHVLVHRPDLVFVEFAVNDSKKQPEEIYKAMEGIVRQIWQENIQTDICFVYTLMADMAPTLQEGKFPQAASAMERVADYYQIPSVHMGLEIVKLEKEGKLIFKGKPEEHPDQLVFSGDNVHPYSQTGHRLYTEALVRSLEEVAKTSRKPARKLGKPMIAGNWQKARLIAVKEAELSQGWQVLKPESDTVARQLQNRFSNLIKASGPGETITFRFKGTRFGLYDVMGPGCGQYEITVDGKPALSYPRFDEYCTYYRANYFFLPEMEDGIHTIELTVSSQKLDKETILSKRGNVIGNPDKYQSNACYAGELMIIGELVK